MAKSMTVGKRENEKKRLAKRVYALPASRMSVLSL